MTSGELLFLNGVRRSGKTTLMLQAIEGLLNNGTNPKQIFSVNFDDPAFGDVKNPLAAVLDCYHSEVYPGKDCYLFLDEIQAVPAWERQIKKYYDLGLYRIVLSGSSAHLLGTTLANLLSGRYFQIQVFPLDFTEYLAFNNVAFQDAVSLFAQKDRVCFFLNEYLSKGGFPRAAMEKDDLLRQDLLKSYYDSIIFKDIVSTHSVRKIDTLKTFIHYLFTNFASLYSIKGLARLLHLDHQTATEYIRYLHDAHLVTSIPLFDYSLKIQERNNRKAYCVDNGLRNSVSFKFSSDSGRLAENVAFNALNRGHDQVYYWKGKGEVDFVIKNSDQTLWAINICFSNDIPERERESLFEFKKEFPDKSARLVILTKDVEKIEMGIEYIPLWKWLCMLEGKGRGRGEEGQGRC